MALMLPAVSNVLEGRSPVVGVPAEAEAASRTLARMRDETDMSYMNSLGSLRYLNALQGDAVSKLASGIGNSLVPGTTQLSEDLAEASNALGRYADEIERIHTAARNIEGEVEQLLGQIRSCADELTRAAETLRIRAHAVPSAWNERPSIVPPVTSEVLGDLTPAEAAARVGAGATWTTQALSWIWAADRADECRASWSKLISERREAEQQLVAKLNSTKLGSLLAFGGVPTRAMITRSYTGGRVHPTRLGGDPLLTDILSGKLTPEETAKAWDKLGLSADEVSKLPIEVLFGLAKADGVPFRVQDIASRAALDYSLKNPRSAVKLLGLGSEMSVSKFTEQITNLQDGLLGSEVWAKRTPGKPAVQLVGFGSHDGALTAAISLGNIDTASNVAVNVSGMNSNVGGIGNGVQGARTLFSETLKADPGVVPAIVTWIGYRSPGLGDVSSGDRAASGAVPLSRFLDGINVIRGAGNQPLEQFVLLGHSYGSTTSAEALKIMTTEKVDAFITYGSAGLNGGTEVSDLNADKVYLTKADGDDVARWGYVLNSRTDPRGTAGVEEFSSEGDNGGKPVTVHDMFAEEGEWSFINPSKVGYLSVGTEASGVMGKIIAGEKP